MCRSPQSLVGRLCNLTYIQAGYLLYICNILDHADPFWPLSQRQAAASAFTSVSRVGSPRPPPPPQTPSAAVFQEGTRLGRAALSAPSRIDSSLQIAQRTLPATSPGGSQGSPERWHLATRQAIQGCTFAKVGRLLLHASFGQLQVDMTASRDAPLSGRILHKNTAVPGHKLT